MNTHIPLSLIGISHKTAPVEIREALAFSKDEQQTLIHLLPAKFHLGGTIILSTCNRTELYLSGEVEDDRLQELRQYLNEFKHCDYFTNDQFLYSLKGKEAVFHFFQVISGLDSQILGEPQITGQVKNAYQMAYELNGTDALLNKLVNYGLQAEKKVRSQTFLSDGAVSVSYAGVELARKIFTNLNDKIALLVGAGETAELAAQHFMEKGVGKIMIANRTYQKAQELAEKFAGEAFPLNELPNIIHQVDIVISATSSTDYVLTREMIEPYNKKRSNSPLFLIDLAIPRDIDPELDELDFVYLYNLDDLNEVVQSNLTKRQKEVPKAEKIILHYVHEFVEWLSTHASSQIINRLRSYFETLRKNELQRLKSRLPQQGFENVEYLTESITNKILHQHIKLLKANLKNPIKYEQYLEFLESLYEFNENE